MSYSSRTNTIKSGATQYTRTLGYPNGFAGVDLSTPDKSVNLNRFADCRNVWKDYKDQNGACIQTFPGWRRVRNWVTGAIYGIWRYKGFILVHAGRSLFAFPHSSRDGSGSVTVIDGTQEPSTPTDRRLKEQPSCGFVANDAFWLLGGAQYRKITYDADRQIPWQWQAVDTIGYQPTLYASHTVTDGSAAPAQYEQRNMLSFKFTENFIAKQNELQDVTANPGIIYTIMSETEHTCRASCDTSLTASSTLYIPGNVSIGGENYNVVAIDNFHSNSATVTLLIGEGVKTISNNAFWGFTGLRTIVLPSTLEGIGANAFNPGPLSFDVYVGWGGYNTEESNAYSFMCAKLRIDTAAFATASKEHGTIKFTGTNEQLHAIKEQSNMTSEDYYFYEEDWASVLITQVGYSGMHHKYMLPIYSTWDGSSTGLTVTLSGTALEKFTTEQQMASAAKYYDIVEYDGTNKRIIIAVKNVDDLFGKTVSINGNLNNAKYNDGNYQLTYADCINYCTKAVEYDGRIFFFGHHRFPNHVWYTQRDLQGKNRPEYVGELNYWTDGATGSKNVAMLPYADILIVLQQSESNAGIYIHSGQNGNNDLTPRIYPSTWGNMESVPHGAVCNFADDAVFVSNRGLDAIAKQQVNLERSIEHRSSNVDSKLLTEDLTNCRLVEFEGYLILLCRGTGNVYMADSRQMFTHDHGDTQYEWYFIDELSYYSGMDAVFLTDIGPFETTYYVTEDEEMYHEVVADSSEHEVISAVQNLELYTFDEEEEEFIATGEYADIDSSWHMCHATGEYRNGTKKKATEILVTDGVLYFGCEDGSVCCLNTDKRGVNYGQETVEPGQIHRRWYDRCGRAYVSSVTTCYDDCGYPHVRKNTVPHSVDLLIRTKTDSALKICWRTERNDAWEAEEVTNRINFFGVDFSNFAVISEPSTIHVLKEKEKLWVNKQYYFESSAFRSSFGLFNIVYRWQVCRRIKN